MAKWFNDLFVKLQTQKTQKDKLGGHCTMNDVRVAMNNIIKYPNAQTNFANFYKKMKEFSIAFHEDLAKLYNYEYYFTNSTGARIMELVIHHYKKSALPVFLPRSCRNVKTPSSLKLVNPKSLSLLQISNNAARIKLRRENQDEEFELHPQHYQILFRKDQPEIPYLSYPNISGSFVPMECYSHLTSESP